MLLLLLLLMLLLRLLCRLPPPLLLHHGRRLLLLKGGLLEPTHTAVPGKQKLLQIMLVRLLLCVFFLFVGFCRGLATLALAAVFLRRRRHGEALFRFLVPLRARTRDVARIGLGRGRRRGCRGRG